MTIAIISASVRFGRESHRVSLFFKRFISEQYSGDAEILDLAAYNFPVFDERLKFQEKPLPAAIEFSNRVKAASGVIIVTPEYNGGYPASLKNVVDLLTDEWKRKPVAICTVSSGAFGGSQVITSLQFSLWKQKAWTVNAHFPVPNVSGSFNEEGQPTNKDAVEKRAKAFLEELQWCITAKQKMEEQ